MEPVTKLQELSTNLIAFIYQYLTNKEMTLASSCCKKMRQAFNRDFIYIELAKRDHLFLPSEGEKFGTWKEYFLYLKELNKNISSGKPNVGFKMIPYRGHKSPIEAVAVFNHKEEMSTTIVSGDSNGEVLTWNVDEDGDKEKDLIFKGDSKIVGIKNMNNDSNMLVWTSNNTFYYYNVNMVMKTEKNSERFQLEKQFKIEDNDNPIKQVYYEESTSRLYMSPDFSDDYNLNNIYCYNFKTSTFDKFKFDYNSSQTNSVLNNNNPNNNNNNLNQGWNAYNNNNNNNNNNLFNPGPIHILPVMPHPIHPWFPPVQPVYDDINRRVKDSRKKNIYNFVVTEDKVISYINKEPVRHRLISSYNSKRDLPNVFVFKKNTFLPNGYHIDLDTILNILPINNAEVAFIGINTNPNNYRKQVVLKVYYLAYFSQAREIVLSDNNENVEHFDMIFYKNPTLYYLINETKLKKIENIGVKQLTINDIGTLKKITSINCIESDDFRIVIGSDELFLAVFDIKTGKLWFNLLGGSKTVFPKSYVKHPNYEGFHYLKVTRNAIISLMGNLIREYRFTFKYKK